MEDKTTQFQNESVNKTKSFLESRGKLDEEPNLDEEPSLDKALPKIKKVVSI